MIQVQHLKSIVNGNIILRDLNFEINSGEVIGIVGPSGCGKSLLLRCMVELHKSDGGQILFDGKKLRKHRNGALLDNNKIGMVFQNYNLFEHLTVLENVASGPLHLTKKDPKKILDETTAIINGMGLGNVAYQFPATLSGGQKQRVAIARTLALDPEIILMDDPTSALDPLMKGEIEAVIRLLAAQGRTMIIVSNEMEIIKSVCKRVFFLYEGVVYEEGTPEEIFENPRKEATRRFVKELRVLDITVESKNFDFIGINTRIGEYCFSNGISSSLQDKLKAILEELFQMVIIQPIDDNHMTIAFEYDRKNQSLVGDVQFTGPFIDPDDPMFFFSWPIIERRASEVEVKQLTDNLDGFTNDVRIIIK